MAKDAERKRKLEQDQTEQTATPKRLKQSKGDSAKKSRSKINGDAAGSPMVVISRTESRDSAKQTPQSNRNETKPSSNGKRSESKLGAKQDANTMTPSKVKKEDVDVKMEVDGTNTPASSKKSKKKKNRKSAQEGEVKPSIADTEAGAGKDASHARDKTPKSKKSQSNAGALIKAEDGDDGQTTPGAKKNNPQRKADKKARRQSQDMISVGLAENEELSAPNQHGWWMSTPTAGRYLDHDPIFVTDENGDPCLVAATNREIQLLSLESSLVVRSHVVPEGRNIVCYSLSTNDKECVDVAYDNGTKVQWNWITSELVKGTFPGQETTTAMVTARMDDGRFELFYIARNQSTYTIVGERKALYTTERRLKSMQVLRNGWYIVCVSATALILGARKETTQSEYVWVEIPFEKPIRSADARLVYTEPGKKKSGRRPDLAVAVGDTEGIIQLYSNASSVFASPSNVKLPAPTYLHWHREPVSAVRFSKDGNYLLSGGRETVLVLWQLETGHKQFLPHLTAEVERIVVSSNGTRYALQMGDNSIMVLSSSELKPVANFAGLQLPVSYEAEGVYMPTTTAVLHPKDPHQLLLSVPATQPKTGMDVAARPFLQAFDIRNTRHLSRQALDRNNVTDLSRGPEKTPIVPPDVNLMAVSADGKWLATVAEWYPPASDLEHVVGKTTSLDAQEITEVQDQQQHRREIHLRFWRWSEDLEMWTLSTRVDSPHARFLDADPGSGAGSVLKLVADPSSNTFATVGADSNIKIWKPKMRTKYGLPLKEDDGSDAVDWVCKRDIPLPTSSDAVDRADSPMDVGDELTKMVDISEAALVFSQDGSMLACGNGTTDEDALPLINFVSPTTGASIATKTGLVAAEQQLLDFGFIDHYFVSLSTGAVRVWNLIDDSHQYTISLSGMHEDQEEAMLAINHFDETFAVVSYVPVKGTDQPMPKVEVYGPKKTESLFEAELSTTPVKILAGNGIKGYTILFEDGTIRGLSSAAPAVRPQTGLLAVKDETSSELAVVQQRDDDVEMADAIDTDGNALLALSAGDYTSVAVEDDRPVVRPEQLAEIFDTGSGLGLPPVRDMFQAVVGLFGRKPRDFSGDAMEVEVV